MRKRRRSGVDDVGAKVWVSRERVPRLLVLFPPASSPLAGALDDSITLQFLW